MKADTIIPDQYLAASNAQSCYSSVDICYYIAFGIYCFFHLLERTNYNSILGVSIDSIGKISTALMLVFVCARLATVRFQLTGFVRSAIVLSASLLVFIATRSWICLSLAMFVVAGKDIDVKPMVVTMLVTTILVVALVFLVCIRVLLQISHQDAPENLRSEIRLVSIKLTLSERLQHASMSHVWCFFGRKDRFSK